MIILNSNITNNSRSRRPGMTGTTASCWSWWARGCCSRAGTEATSGFSPGQTTHCIEMQNLGLQADVIGKECVSNLINFFFTRKSMSVIYGYSSCLYHDISIIISICEINSRNSRPCMSAIIIIYCGIVVICTKE